MGKTSEAQLRATKKYMQGSQKEKWNEYRRNWLYNLNEATKNQYLKKQRERMNRLRCEAQTFSYMRRMFRDCEKDFEANNRKRRIAKD